MELDIFEKGLVQELLRTQLQVTEGCDPKFVYACEDLYNRCLREK